MKERKFYIKKKKIVYQLLTSLLTVVLMVVLLNFMQSEESDFKGFYQVIVNTFFIIYLILTIVEFIKNKKKESILSYSNFGITSHLLMDTITWKQIGDIDLFYNSKTSRIVLFLNSGKSKQFRLKRSRFYSIITFKKNKVILHMDYVLADSEIVYNEMQSFLESSKSENKEI